LNVGSLLSRSAARFPDKIALIEGERKVSYYKFNNRVNKLANKLLRLNIQKGDKVSLYLHNSIEWVEIYFALSKIGVVIVPINFRLKGNELVYIIRNSDSKFLFFDTDLQQNIESVKMDLKGINEFILLGDTPKNKYLSYEELFKNTSSIEPNVSVSEEDIHSICYTSGTTGLPKGAVLTNLNILTVHYLINTAEFGVTLYDTILITTSISQRIGWAKLVTGIALGSTLVIMTSFDAQEAIKIVKKEKVTIMSIVPTILRLILQTLHIESYNSTSLRVLFVGGEAFPIELKKDLTEKLPNIKLVSYYASTEAGHITTLLSEDILKKPYSVGRPIPCAQVKIVDEEGEEMIAGEVGEIIVRSGKPGTFCVMKEYYKEPDYTKESFWGEWFRTGDVGRLDNDGYLYIVDRKKDMIVSGGYNIYSKEIEMLLESYEKVYEAAVIGVPDEKYGEAVKAFIVLKKGMQATENELIEYCKANMASYKKPRYIEFVDFLPKNVTGKVLKYKLKEIESYGILVGKDKK